MRMLFKIDKEDYDIGGSVFSRPSARGIIIKNGKVAMAHSQKYDYYKFPGGGIENDECKEHALIREVLEETGLCVIPESIKEYGQVRRIQKGTAKQQNLDEYEADEGFALKYVSPQFAIDKNRQSTLDEFSRVMLDRDAKVLEILIQEGYLGREDSLNENAQNDTV